MFFTKKILVVYKLFGKKDSMKITLMGIFMLLFFILPFNLWGLITHFNRLGVKDGLPQPSVMAIYQDEFGTVWFGTRQGLCKYNGFYIEPLTLDKDYSSPVGKTVTAIYGNRNGLLFFLINDQLVAHNLKTEKQTLLTGLSVGHFYANEERLVFSSGNKIYQLVYQQGNIVEVAQLSQTSLPVNAITISKTNKTLVACNDGIIRLSANGQLTETLLSGYQCTAVKEVDNNGYWVGTKSKGLIYLKSSSEIIPVLDNHFRGSDIRCIEVDSQNTVWFGTINGLHSYNPAKKETVTYVHDERKPYSLSHSSVYAIFEDDYRTIWVGTYFGGISYFNRQQDVFKFYNVSKGDRFSLSHPIVGNITEDENDNIWICTEGGGLNQLNRTSGEITVYDYSKEGNSVSHNNLKAIWHDANRNKLYIGTHTGGLSVFDLSTKRFSWYKHMPNNSNSIPHDVISNIVATGDSLIVATQNGLAVFDLNTAVINRFKFKNDLFAGKENVIRSIYIDSKKRMWLLLNADSLVCYDLVTGSHKTFSHHPNNPGSFTKNRVNSVLETRDGDILFATEGDGLLLLDETVGGFKYLTRENFGLMSNYCYNLSESSSGKLIVTTYNGIMVVDRVRGLETFLTIRNNIPLSGIIRENGLFISKNRDLFLGGIGGMVVLPEEK
jgi:ligand-binding sensor domain-containing protein